MNDAPNLWYKVKSLLQGTLTVVKADDDLPAGAMVKPTAAGTVAKVEYDDFGEPKDSSFQEEEHPRYPAGSPKGGQFAPKEAVLPPQPQTTYADVLPLQRALPPEFHTVHKGSQNKLIKLRQTAAEAWKAVWEGTHSPGDAIAKLQGMWAGTALEKQYRGQLANDVLLLDKARQDWVSVREQYGLASVPLPLVSAGDLYTSTQLMSLQGQMREALEAKDLPLAQSHLSAAQDLLLTLPAETPLNGQVGAMADEFTTVQEAMAESAKELQALELGTEPQPPTYSVKPGSNADIWNKNKIFALQSAAASSDPVAALLSVSLPKTSPAYMVDYRNALLKYHQKAAAFKAAGGMVPAPKPLTGTGSPPPASATQAAQAVKAKAPKVMAPLPEPPAPDTSGKYTAEQIAVFHQKIAALRTAAMGKDPLTAIDSIQPQSTTIGNYKAKLVDWVMQHTDVPDAVVGQTVSSYEIIGDHGLLDWAPFAQHSVATFRPKAQAYRAALPGTQQNAVSYYQGSGYHALNAHRFNPGAALPANHKALDAALAGFTLDRDTYLVRNINSKTLATVAPSLVGRIVQDPAYMSTSLHGHFASGSSVRLHINAPKGTRGLFLDTSGAVHHEEEWLLARRTRFRVHRVKKDGNTTHIYVTLLPPEEQHGIPK